MTMQNKYRILVWIVVILVATNLSMGVSFLYHKQQEQLPEVPVKESSVEMPAQQRTRFFREQLDLAPDQVEVFRELNRNFNRIAKQIQYQLSGLRMEMVDEMGKEQADTQKLNDIATSIGELHKELKNETISFYLAMKEACTEEQQQKLQTIFISILEENEDVSLPQRGRGYRFNRQRLDEQIGNQE